MTKGERLNKDMKAFREIETKISWEVGFGHEYGQRGSNIEELRRIKILGQEKHTSRESKLMNFDWLHVMCLLAFYKFLSQNAFLCGVC